MFTTNSGVLVPKATTVRPMIMVRTFSERAIPEAPLTNSVPPTSNSVTPMASNKKGIELRAPDGQAS
jgi:hypothetical protein